jgi:hypothetical protein
MNITQLTAEQTANDLMIKGLQCYCVARQCYVLWIPWAKKAIDLGKTQTIKHFFGLPGGKFTSDFVSYCIRNINSLPVPEWVEVQFPMPKPPSGERHPRHEDMMKWTQTILKHMKV